MFQSPFEQFTLNSLSSSHYFNNLNLVILVVLLYLISFFSIVFFFRREFNKLSFWIMSKLYVFFYYTVEEYLTEEGLVFFPFIFYLFLSIAFLNLVGLLPYAFTVTSHFFITLTFAFIVWYGIIFITASKIGLRFLTIFVPSGLALALGSFISLIEVVSYMFRVVSLALRLFANVVAGHILLETLALFAFKFVGKVGFGLSLLGLVISLLPFIIVFVFFLFECVIAIIQAYVFVLLTCIYLQDVFRFAAH